MQRRTNRESCFSEIGPNLDTKLRQEIARIATQIDAKTNAIYVSSQEAQKWKQGKHPSLKVTWQGGQMRLPMDE